MTEGEAGVGETAAGASSSGMVARPRATATGEPGAEAAVGGAAGSTAAEDEAAPTGTAAATPEPPAPTESPTAEPTPTLFPTATLEPTPAPTATPTPIVGPTARVGDSTSTLPVRKTPNGESVALVYRGETVLLLSGRAFHSGGLWREVSTVNGVVGWVQDVFLDYGDGAG
jgi:hypothetical protein